MYRLVSGFVAHLTQKQEVRCFSRSSFLEKWGLLTFVPPSTVQYSVLIMGLDNAGKTTFLGALLVLAVLQGEGRN
jgi:hypothetical protein